MQPGRSFLDSALRQQYMVRPSEVLALNKLPGNNMRHGPRRSRLN
jgi:hypothetical protein